MGIRRVYNSAMGRVPQGPVPGPQFNATDDGTLSRVSGLDDNTNYVEQWLMIGLLFKRLQD